MGESTGTAAPTPSQEVVALANAVLARSALWRLLSQAFAYPRPETVAQLVEEDLPLALAVSEPLPAAIRDSLGRFSGAIRDAQVGPRAHPAVLFDQRELAFQVFVYQRADNMKPQPAT